MFVVGYIIIGLVLFFTAGTVDYWQAWISLAVGVISYLPLMWLMMKNPVLLENRTTGGPLAEKRVMQKNHNFARYDPGYRHICSPCA